MVCSIGQHEKKFQLNCITSFCLNYDFHNTRTVVLINIHLCKYRPTTFIFNDVAVSTCFTTMRPMSITYHQYQYHHRQYSKDSYDFKGSNFQRSARQIPQDISNFYEYNCISFTVAVMFGSYTLNL
jgi:hypothetical protein